MSVFICVLSAALEQGHLLSPYSVKEQLVSVRESSEEFLQENQKLREELNQQTVLATN